jgi:hypothetical protein
MRDIQGDFETHFTVTPAVDVALLQSTAEQFGLKWSLIELARGESRSQPMLTACASGRVSEIQPLVVLQAANLARAGLSVTRVKIEASPVAIGIPHTLDEVCLEPPGRYFEQHIKLVLDSDLDLRSLEALATLHDAHMSRNARRQRLDGRQERFVTQRCYSCGQGVAQAALQQLLRALQAANYEVMDCEAEYVVYDSNLALDAGWLTRGAAP